MTIPPGAVISTERGYLRVTSEVTGRRADNGEGYYGVPVRQQDGKYVDTTRVNIFVPAREVIEIVYPVYRRMRWRPS